MAAGARSELRAGLLVFLGICGAIAALLSLPHAFTSWTSYTTAVPLAWSADGLHFGSRVLLGGIHVGQVDAVEYVGSDVEQPVVVLSFVVKSTIQLREGTSAGMARDLVSGQAELLVIPPAVPGALLAPGAFIPLAPSATIAETAFGPMAGAIFSKAQSDLSSFSREWQSLPPPGETMSAVSRGWTALSAHLDDRAARWSESWESALGAARRARASASGLTAEVIGEQSRMSLWRERYLALIAQFPQIRDDAMAIQSAFSAEMSPRGEAVFTRAMRAREGMLEELQLLDDVAAEARLVQGEARAEMVLLAEQIDRLTTEVVLMPWSLLGGVFGDPGAQQQALHELAQATTDLQEALAALRNLLEAAPEVASRHPELLRLLRAWLEAAGANAVDVSEAVRSLSGGQSQPTAP